MSVVTAAMATVVHAVVACVDLKQSRSKDKRSPKP
jgi:hypothetical protein